MDHYSPLSPARLEAAYYSTAADVWETVKSGAPPSWGNMEAEPVVHEVWSGALKVLGVSDEDIAGVAVSNYYRHLTDLGAPVFSDVLACLDVLRSDYRLGVITNGCEAIQQAKLEGAGLAEYFQCVTTTDIGVGKPDERVFEHALACLDVQPAAAAYVGDSLQWDVRGANGADMMSVWLNRTGATREGDDPVPDAEISDLMALPRLIARTRES